MSVFFKTLSLKTVILIPVLLIQFLVSYSQVLSENDIKKVAQKINSELRGTDMGNGIMVRGCFAVERTIIYQYDVGDYWYPPENMKKDLISNFKIGGYAEMYYKNDVNVDFQYYNGNKLIKKISIKSNEFSDLDFELVDYISIDGHPKAKGVNLKIKPPSRWEVKEGDRPNIVKKFVYQSNTYMVIIKDNFTFLSKNEAEELLKGTDFRKEFINEATSYLKNPVILNQGIVSVDKYPALVFTFKGLIERSDFNAEFISKNWIVFYEDKIVFLQSGGINGKEFNSLENLYDSITNSIIFPEQYNY